jgi:hypothetical protein
LTSARPRVGCYETTRGGNRRRVQEPSSEWGHDRAAEHLWPSGSHPLLPRGPSEGARGVLELPAHLLGCQGTPEFLAKRAYLINGSDPQLAATASGILEEHAPDDAREQLAARVVEHLEQSGFPGRRARSDAQAEAAGAAAPDAGRLGAFSTRFSSALARMTRFAAVLIAVHRVGRRVRSNVVFTIRREADGRGEGHPRLKGGGPACIIAFLIVSPPLFSFRSLRIAAPRTFFATQRRSRLRTAAGSGVAWRKPDTAPW